MPIARHLPAHANLAGTGVGDDELLRAFRTYNAAAEPFRRESETHER